MQRRRDGGNRVIREDLRYDVSSLGAVCFIRNVYMRATSFEGVLQDISLRGARIRTAGRSFIEYKEGDVLAVTLDISGRVFSRPVHAIYKVSSVTRGENDTHLSYGLTLVEVNSLHSSPYHSGLAEVSRTAHETIDPWGLPFEPALKKASGY